MRKIDITGQRYGHLVALKEDVASPPKRRKWVCLCDCGNTKSVRFSHLRSGATTSCGCKHYVPIHGMRDSRIYGIWNAMKQRCENPKAARYGAYGGRGITVCEAWSKSFQEFYAWSTANGYTDELTIDRIDNSKGYSPDNCRWVSRIIQQNNRRINHWVVVDGNRMTLTQAARKYGVDAKRIGTRLARGWSFERAFEWKIKSGYDIKTSCDSSYSDICNSNS